MRVTARTEYGLRAMLDIARHQGDGVVSNTAISERENIPQRFLEQILIVMRAAGIITARRGAKGGYRLTRPPSKITVAEILEHTDATILDSTLSESAYDGSKKAKEVFGQMWVVVDSLLVDLLTKTTLADLLKK
jgi:Rrf2 family protein